MGYPWQKLLNCLINSVSGANKKLHSTILGRGQLDINILRLIKPLYSVSELLSRLRRKAYDETMIHND